MGSEHTHNQGQTRAYAVTQAAHDAAARAAMQYPGPHSDGLGGLVSSFGALGLAGNNVPQGTAPLAMPHTGYMHADAAAVYPAYSGHLPPGYGIPGVSMGMAQIADPYTGVTGGPYMAQAGIPAGYGQYIVPFTPGRAASYADRIDRGGLRDVPALDNRRASYSTTATESTPGTPFFGGISDRHNGPRVISADRSSYTTPSPQQIAVSGMIGPITSKGKLVAEAELRALVEQDPAVPAAVPAVFTTPEQRKSLDQCLDNRIEGNKNVYIRGLHPTTDDELLANYAARFGEVEQSKAIIDTATGACKG